MIYADYKGNDTYEYSLTTGRTIELTDEELEEINTARLKQKDKGFRSNASLSLLGNEYLQEDEDEENE